MPKNFLLCLIFLFSERRDQQLEDNILHDGMEIRKTFLVLSNLIGFFTKDFTLKQLAQKN